MNYSKLTSIVVALVLSAFLLTAGCVSTGVTQDSGSPGTITVTDALGRTVEVPEHPERVVCSGAGTLRYLTYLQAQDRIVGVDDIEQEKTIFDARAYALANPQFADYPLIGESGGNDDPEKIVACAPQVIFKTYVTASADADELQAKTGIPVVALNYGSLGVYREDMNQALRLMGQVMGKEQRAEEIIAFFDAGIADLNSRTADIPDDQKKSTYVGGIASRGPHGFQSTEPAYPPFIFVNAKNVAGSMGSEHADVAKEKIVEWNPDVIFVDLSTLQKTPSAIDELKYDPAYQQLDAVKKGEVYGVLPYNWYTTNHGNVLADAYYIGTVLYPDRFGDVDPAAKADEIYTFLVGKPVFSQLDQAFQGMAFDPITL